MTGNLKANSEPVCASPSEGAHAPFVCVHPLIFGLETFVSCSFWVNLILPLILLLEKQFLSFCFSCKHTLYKKKKKKVSVSIHQGKQRIVILWHFAALHQPLSTALCSFSSPLLLRRFQSFTPFSLMGLLKHSPRTKSPPSAHPMPMCLSPMK